jgi:hypothetical protein
MKKTGRQSLQGFQKLVLGAKWFLFSSPVFRTIFVQNINDYSSGLWFLYVVVGVAIKHTILYAVL